MHTFHDIQRLSNCCNKKLHLMRQLIQTHDARANDIREEIKRNRNAMAKKTGAIQSPGLSPSRSRARDMIEREAARALASADEEQKQIIANAKAAFKDRQSHIISIAQEGIDNLNDDDDEDPLTGARGNPQPSISALHKASSSSTAAQRRTTTASTNDNVARAPRNHPAVIAAAAHRTTSASSASAPSAALGTSNPTLCNAVHILDANAADLSREERKLQEVARNFFGMMEPYSVDPTYRPMYSDIDMVNIRPSRLRHHRSGMMIVIHSA